MRLRLAGAMVLVALPALVFPGRARACSLAWNFPHGIDPKAVGVDKTPPLLPQPRVSDVQTPDQGPGCTQKCGWSRSVTLLNLATDDMTPVDRIGYRLTMSAGGTAPQVPSWNDGEVVLGASDGTLTLDWNGDDAFFTLQVVAVDDAGNESEPRSVLIDDLGHPCSVSGRRGSDGLAPLVVTLALAVAVARRRRR